MSYAHWHGDVKMLYGPIARRQSGRPPAKRKHTLHIDDALWERVQRMAVRDQRSRADMLRVALRLGLEEVDRRWARVHAD
jgi:hypothetical protein